MPSNSPPDRNDLRLVPSYSSRLEGSHILLLEEAKFLANLICNLTGLAEITAMTAMANSFVGDR